ncbi:related to protein kinase RAD53 [Cephalotrichum gorgonifer]|uniref:Autophagy-related protein 1 n=1 Tax=Cephalotrichum gorgonifer TaxID=2041049 RepID=A0AAE8MQ25_9PEZI|nr:related to protein kinase RAD53 [Cephalotrichum gorgonifer]
MDADDEQPTQATQNVVDPRRTGKQNSGFSDDDISDIVCVLHPHSNHARRETARLALANSPYVFGRDEVDNVDADFSLEDKASRFNMAPPGLGNHVIVLKLSAAMKDPHLGFTFGRNTARCDVCFDHDPYRRLSNIHFRVFVNDYGVVMLEDQSTNGTIVDTVLLKSKSHAPAEKRRMLTSGSRIKILMHQEDMDLEFMVRIPRREGAYDAAYRDRLNDYFARLAALRNNNNKPMTVSPGPGGPPNLFAPPNGHAAAAVARRTPLPEIRGSATPPPGNNHRTRNVIPIEWDGSDKYNRVGVIGRGAFAVVYQVTSKSDGSPYAAKELEKRHFMKNGVLDQKVENEMNIMRGLQHPNIVRYIENFDWDDRLLIIIMEFIDGGDLGKFIHRHGPLPEVVVQAMAGQLLDAFEYLHERGITHRDVKPDNILVNSVEPFDVKLTDFGLSKMVNNEETFLRTFCGTLLYCAPEVYTEFGQYDMDGKRNPRLRGHRPAVGQRYDHAVDIWSLGGVLFFALTGKPPYPVQSGVSYSELLYRIMTTDLDVSPLQKLGVSRDGIEFLRLMLQKRPELRSTVRELRRHRWIGGSQSSADPAESLDEITDDDLPVDASQLSLEENHSAQVDQARPDSEILGGQFDDMDQYSSDVSQKENHAGGHHHQKAKNPAPLFGEVNVSAIGSSGVIPEHRLNLRVTGPSDSAAETVILDSQRPDSFDDSDHFTPHRRSQPKEGGARLSIGPHNQSADQLQSLVENVQSQSLGDAGSVIRNTTLSVSSGNATSLSASGAFVQPAEFTASKRKPNYDTSDEFGEGSGGGGHGRPTFKRLKSDLNLESLSADMLEEYRLIASIPAVQRLESGRQIDRPVHKTIFWDRKDPDTHHVDYPEMTQLQLDVFEQAARDKGQTFEPGDSPLWRLAMRYFPPTNWDTMEVEEGKENDPPPPAQQQQIPALPRREPRRFRDDMDMDIPSTAQLPLAPSSDEDEDSIPDTAPQDNNIIVPIREEDPSQSRIVGLFESAPGSAIPDISIPLTGPILSWGRGAENTHVYETRTEARVPKYAFKTLLYKEGFDASKDRNPRPWLRAQHQHQHRGFGRSVGSGGGSGDDEEEAAFYICTKATNGVWVNDYRLISHDSRKPSSPAHHWIKLHTGDEIVVWGDPSDAKPKTRVVFRSFWGASAAERTSPTAAVHAGLARRLDEICVRAERRSRSEAEYKASMDAAVRDHALRERFVERERGRSRVFEGVRREAMDVLALLRRSPAGRT